MKRIWAIGLMMYIIIPNCLIAQNKFNYNLSFSKECLFLSGGLSLNLLGSHLLSRVDPPDSRLLNEANLPWFDRFAIYCDNQFTDNVSDITLIMSIVLPAISTLQADSKADKHKGVLLYLESVLLTNGVTHIVKALVHRARPYAYRRSQEELDSNAAQSFISGHTSLAFNGAMTAGMLFQSYQNDSKWNTPVWILGISLATSTGIFRITSGNHFLSDVIVGALVGIITSCLIMNTHH